MTLRIKNWSKLQHFKDRTPPWIKLYRDILDDPDWHELDGDTAKTLIGLWLIASEDATHNGALPSIRKLAFRLRINEQKLNQQLTKLSHWLVQDDIAPISEGYRGDAPETERETERERETETDSSAADDSANRRPQKIVFDDSTASFVGITEEQELRWQDAFPAIPIPPAIAQAAAWLKANPANRKKNCERFLVNWFSRAQEKAPRVSR